MTMRQRIARLFTIKTRTEALLVTYAIAVGAIERGLHYMEQYPGYSGVVLALACLGVPFIAGAKLLDAVRPAPAPVAVRANPARRRDDDRLTHRRAFATPSSRRASQRPFRRRV